MPNNLCALLTVDVQNDFCPGGALEVREGDRVVPVLNRYIEKCRASQILIIASRDWHPEKTKHFKPYGGLWPPHCIQHTKGAQFHPDLKLPKETVIVSKGMDPDKESYSAFQAFDSEGTPLAHLLKKRRITHLLVGGLATDYCVRASVLDALTEGFRVTVLKDAIRGVELKTGDSKKAFDEMKKAGADQASLETFEIWSPSTER